MKYIYFKKNFISNVIILYITQKKRLYHKNLIFKSKIKFITILF